MRQSVRDRLNGFRRDAHGGTAIEFALVAPVLFFVLLSLVEIGVLCMMTTGIDAAVTSVARSIRTGQDDAPATAGDFEARVCAKLGGDLDSCRERLSVSVQTVARFADVPAAAAGPPGGQYTRGAAGDVMLVKADYVWPLVTPFVLQGYERSGPQQVVIASRTTFKNEPFS